MRYHLCSVCSVKLYPPRVILWSISRAVAQRHREREAQGCSSTTTAGCCTHPNIVRYLHFADSTQKDSARCTVYGYVIKIIEAQLATTYGWNTHIIPMIYQTAAVANVEAASRRFHPIQVDEVGFFDPNDLVAFLEGNLPHWRQDVVTYFVTFRTDDSIPQEKLTLWRTERDDWLKNNPEPHTPEQKNEYWMLFPKRIHDWLDAGYGECMLKDPSLRKVVVEGIEHFAGDRYLLREWVVMPNHVHLIVTPIGEHQLSDILHSWKSFTAKEVNKRAGRKGTFWQKESFDHIVRSPESLERIGTYIAANPDGLPMGSYSLSADAQMRRDAASTLPKLPASFRGSQ